MAGEKSQDTATEKAAEKGTDKCSESAPLKGNEVLSARQDSAQGYQSEQAERARKYNEGISTGTSSHRWLNSSVEIVDGSTKLVGKDTGQVRVDAKDITGVPDSRKDVGLEPRVDRDAMERPCKVEYPDGTSNRVEYDPDGNVTKVYLRDDSTIEREGDHWKITQEGESFRWDGEIQVTEEGDIASILPDGRTKVRHVDGSETVIEPGKVTETASKSEGESTVADVGRPPESTREARNRSEAEESYPVFAEGGTDAISDAAKTIFEACEGLGTDNEAIVKTLEGMTAAQRQQLEQFYLDTYKISLEDQLISEADTSLEREYFVKLLKRRDGEVVEEPKSIREKDREAVDRDKIKEAAAVLHKQLVEDSWTDDDVVEDTLKKLSDAEREVLEDIFEEEYEQSLRSALDEEYDGEELESMKALLDREDKRIQRNPDGSYEESYVSGKSFVTDRNGNLTKITERDGTVWELTDASKGEFTSNQGKVIHNVKVGNDGSFSGWDDQGVRHEHVGDTVQGTFLLDRRPDISEEFVRKIEDTIDAIPSADRDALTEGGYRIVAARRMIDVDPNADKEHPRGWPEGDTQENNDAVFDSEKKMVIITETVKVGDSYVTGQGAEALFHEAGHAIDHAKGDVSNSDDFKKAYEQDVANMSPETRRKLEYFLQPGESGRPSRAGRQEAYAGVYAYLRGKTPSPEEMALMENHFPNVIRLLKDKEKS